MNLKNISGIVRAALFFSIAAVYSIFARRKRNRKIIACTPTYLNGNVKAIYDFIIKDKRFSDCDIYWIAHNADELKNLKTKGIKTFLDRDILRIPRFFKTGVWISDHGPYTIPLSSLYKWKILSIKKIKGNSIWIDTWHGIGFKIHKKEEYGQCMSMYDIQFVTSDFFKDIYELKFGFKSEQLVITGYPRTDILLEREINIRDESRPNIDDSKKIILYAPTYENVASFIDIFPWDLEMTLKTLDDFCKKFGCAFCIRPHPNSGIEKSETTIIRNYETIKLIDMNEYPDTQKLLLNTDILITDWSSICFDFILLKKPMLFIDVPPPRADFTLGPDDRPGEIVNDLNELIEALTLIMTEGNGYALNHGNEINKILNKCYKYVDGKSSKRCVDLIHGLINDPN